MLNFLKKQTLLSQIKQDLSKSLSVILSLDVEDIFALLEKPQNLEHAHLALPIFSFCKKQACAPKVLAQTFCDKIRAQHIDFLKSCESASGFINFKFQEAYLQKKLQHNLALEPLSVFCKNTGTQAHWTIDFASPNVAKHINIGHLRAAAVGQALVNISRAFGVKITSINHLGDWGSQFGKLLWAYKTWGKEYDFKNKAFLSLIELYVRFHTYEKTHESVLQEARAIFQQLESGDAELVKLWKYFVELSLKDYNTYWRVLNVKHELVQGESFYISFLQDLKKRLSEKNLLCKNDGAQVVFLEDKNKPPCLIFKNDGASTYAARDLCSLIYRFEQLKADKNIYITGSDQNLHFQQIFEIAGKLQSQWSKKNIHIPFGMYRFKGLGKMSTRKGQAIYVKDILNQACKKVSNILDARKDDLKNKEKISEQVGIGALIFNDLINDCVKDVDFDWDKVLDFHGRSGPFVQYSLVRAQSLLKKWKDKIPTSFLKDFKDPEEHQLLWQIINFEEASFLAFSHFKPHILARYLLQLAKDFNRFYGSQKILGHPRQNDKILLVFMSHRILKKGLQILNVPCPTEM